MNNLQRNTEGEYLVTQMRIIQNGDKRRMMYINT